MILLFSVRRDGKSLTEMAKEEIGVIGGVVAYAAVVAILIILLAVVALVIVNALKDSPWGHVHDCHDHPHRPADGRLSATHPARQSAGSLCPRFHPRCVAVAIWGGQWASLNPTMATGIFTLRAQTLAILIIVYAFAASAVPVWLLLAPRDYLSTFVKLGTIGLLGIGIVALHPTLHMPALTRFVDGSVRSSPEKYFLSPSSPSPAARSAASIL